MASLLEFHGRLFYGGGGPSASGAVETAERVADPGRYDLRVSLHAHRDEESSLWSEDQRAVPVSVGGYFGVVLGAVEPLPLGLFDGSPHWLHAVGLAPAQVQSARMPVLGHAIRVYEQLAALSDQVGALEASSTAAQRRIVNLHLRLRRIEKGRGILTPMGSRMAATEARLFRLDGEEGRVARLEDVVEDVVGPDGDIIDIVERLERLEGVGPGKASVDPQSVADLARRLDELAERMKSLARPRR